MRNTKRVPPLLVRADGGGRIGVGHLMRCLALSQAWQDAGGMVHFVSADLAPALERRLTDEGIVLHEVGCVVGSAADAQQTVTLARQLNAAWIVVDGYQFDSNFQRHVKANDHSLLWIDDYGHAAPYCADIILNQNIYAHSGLYPSATTGTTLLLGSHYILLRREFRPWSAWRRVIPDAARNIVVTMGGSDADNATAMVLEAINRLANRDLCVSVIVGPSNPHVASLTALAKKSPHTLNIQHSVSDMTRLMAWADICVSAAGSTCWELAYMATPMLVASLAENQIAVGDGLASSGIALNMGQRVDVTVDAWYDMLQRLIDDQPQRRKLSRRGRTIVDGQGASRVVGAMLPGTATDGRIELRSATAQDSRWLWNLANESGVRANSFNSESIPWDEHEAWFSRKLASAKTRIWIAEIGGDFAGQIRYDRVSEHIAEIGFSVQPSVRGRGVGTSMLVDSCVMACQTLDVGTVRGIVVQDNAASARAFLKAGFEEAASSVQHHGKDCRVFEWTMGRIRG